MAFPSASIDLESGAVAALPAPEFLITLGVTGGIAAYKAIELVRMLRKASYDVVVVPTPEALSFVGKKTWEAISGNPICSDLDSHGGKVDHVRLGAVSRAFVLAPLTANTMAKIAAGMSDNQLTAAVLSAACPILLAPAMHSAMWMNPATVANVQSLQQRGFYFVGPNSGELAGGDAGIGRMAEPAEIFTALEKILQNNSDAAEKIPAANLPLAGKKVCISGGGTVEAIDPVRYISNRSSGRMAVEIARAALRLGADVTLVAAQMDRLVEADIPAQIEIIRALSALEMAKVMPSKAAEADIVVMAAAVADYRAEKQHTEKMKRGDEKFILEMLPNPDILDLLVKQRRPEQVIIGFAAETGDESTPYLQYGAEKAQRKGADLLAVNLVGENIGFGDVESCLTIFTRTGKELISYSGNKAHIATKLMTLVAGNFFA